MGYKGSSVQGEIPESGAIFMSNIKTYKDCLERKLFGLPSSMSNFVLHVKEGMPLFLFEFERRLLYGVFRATCDGEINIELKAFKQFPAQVRFTTVYDCSPLAEHEFKDVIRDNYFSAKKFKFGLNRKQVSKLMKLFRSKLISKKHPERYSWRCVDKPFEGNARSGDLRMDIRHRLKFDSCDSRGGEIKEVDDTMYINKHIIESRQKEKREGFLKHYLTESDEFGECSRHDTPRKQSDEFGDCRRHDTLRKHLDLRENDTEDGYISLVSKSREQHLDEIGLRGNEFLMDGENKDFVDYNRLQDEYSVRKGFRESLNEHALTNVFSHFNQNDYSNYAPTRINVPDIQLSPCFDDGLSFIPIANGCPFYPSPEKISMMYHSLDERLNRYLDDAGSQSSIFPNFISRNLSSSDAGLHAHEVDPSDNDKRFCKKHEGKHGFGTTHKRVSVFSRLSSNLRHEEQDFETDAKHELNSSVDKVMKVLEKVASNPKERSRKRISVIKQDDANDLPDCKIEDCEFPDVNLKVDADVAYGEVEGESAFKETRLVDFKRRKKSNKIIDGTSKENSECLVGVTSDVGSVANDQLSGMPCKKLNKRIGGSSKENSECLVYATSDVGSVANDQLTGMSCKKSNKRIGVSSKENSECLVYATSDVSSVANGQLTGMPCKTSNKRTGGSVKENSECLVGATSDGGPAVNDHLTDIPCKKSNKKNDGTHEENSVGLVGATSDLGPVANDQITGTPCKKSNKRIDGTSKENTECLVGATSDVGPIANNQITGMPRKKSNKRIDGTSKEKSECLVGATSDVGPIENDKIAGMPRKKSNKRIESECLVGATSDAGSVANDQLTGMPLKRRKLVRPAFVEANFLSDCVNAHESTLSQNDSAVVVLERSEKVDAFIQSMVPACPENTPDDINSTEAGNESSKRVDASIKPVDLMVPTCHENTTDDKNSTEAATESSKKVDASIKPVDLNMIPTSDGSSSSEDEKNSGKAVLESQNSGNEGDGNAESRLVSDVFAEGPPSKDDQNMCGWIEW